MDFALYVLLPTTTAGGSNICLEGLHLQWSDAEHGQMTQKVDTHFLMEGVRSEDEFAS